MIGLMTTVVSSSWAILAAFSSASPTRPRTTIVMLPMAYSMTCVHHIGRQRPASAHASCLYCLAVNDTYLDSLEAGSYRAILRLSSVLSLRSGVLSSFAFSVVESRYPISAFHRESRAGGANQSRRSALSTRHSTCAVERPLSSAAVDAATALKGVETLKYNGSQGAAFRPLTQK